MLFHVALGLVHCVLAKVENAGGQHRIGMAYLYPVHQMLQIADAANELGLGAGTDRPYIETYEGKLIDAKGVKGRYVRFYSKGNTTNKLNHYIEIEVFGKPAA